MLTVISMFSPCTQWVFGPLSPVSGDTSSTGTQVTRDIDTPLVADAVVSLGTNTPPVVDAVVSPDTDVEVSTTTTRVTAGAATEFVVGATSSVSSLTISPTTAPHLLPPPVLSNDIDMDSVPDFLRSHGKGKREVDIFNYLNKVKDPRFQQVLCHYILLEAEDTGGKGQYTQWVHCELIVGSETICLAHAQWVNSGHFQKVPSTKLSGYFLNEPPLFFHKVSTKYPEGIL